MKLSAQSFNFLLHHLVSPKTGHTRINAEKNRQSEDRVGNLKEYLNLAIHKVRLTIDRIMKTTQTFSTLLGKIGFEINHQKTLLQTSDVLCTTMDSYLVRIKSDAQLLHDGALASLQIATTAQKELGAITDEVNEIIASTAPLNELIVKLRSYFEKIESIANTITEISERTKNIALNSSILACKIGSSGKSFSVVASEINLLSIETAKQTQQIDHSINTTQAFTQRLIDQMTASIQVAQQATTIISEASTGFNTIVHSLTEALSVADALCGASQHIEFENRSMRHQIAAIGDSVAAMVKESRRASDEMAHQETIFSTLHETIDKCKGYAATFAAKLAHHRYQEKTLSFVDEVVSRTDPALALYVFERSLMNYLHIRLTRYARSAEIVPYLAQTWMLLEDGKTWYFKIQEGVRFFDGSEVTAEDVKFSFERVVHPAMKSYHANMLTILEGADEYARGSASQISGIKILSKYEIEFKLKNPYNFFLSMLAQPCTSVVGKNSAFSMKPFGLEEIVSAGPFHYGGYDTKRRCDILHANHHFVDGKPYLDTLLIYRKSVEPFNAFKEKILSLFFAVPIDVQKEIASKPAGQGLRRFESKYVNGLNINFSKNNYITATKEIRHAMSYAIDKQRIVEEAYENNAILARCILHDSIIDTADRPYFEYNPQRAKQIFTTLRSKVNTDAPIT
ncbi:MAG: hypothetical protein JW795_13830, partial [Chitinivibrionales bacterium]|nr:hypothetical protein [Chitinivibrionales bacterium]